MTERVLFSVALILQCRISYTSLSTSKFFQVMSCLESMKISLAYKKNVWILRLPIKTVNVVLSLI